MPLQPSNKVGGAEKSGLADLIDGKEADSHHANIIAPAAGKGKKKAGSAVYKEFEHLQGAPMLYPDEVLVIHK